MKTQRQTQEKEEREQTTEGQRDFKLDQDERLIYSEPLQKFEGNLFSTTLTLTLILGFPIYAIAGFTALTSYLSEKTMSEFTSELAWIPTALLCLITVTAIMAKFLEAAANGLNRNGARFVITNQRMFNYFPTGLLKKVFECKYSDLRYVYPTTIGKQHYLVTRYTGKDSETGNSCECEFKFPVKDARRAYMQIPEQVTADKGDKSSIATKFNQQLGYEKIGAYGVLSIFILFVGFFSITFYASQICESDMHKGRKAYIRGDYLTAEGYLKKSYERIKWFPYLPYTGPAAYRYAQALDANSKFDLAIPVFQQAIQKCGWENHDEGVNWKPAVFRSNVKLGEIYAKKNQFAMAEIYFDEALNTRDWETNKEKAKGFFDIFASFLEQRGKHSKASFVREIESKYEVKTSNGDSFRD